MKLPFELELIVYEL